MFDGACARTAIGTYCRVSGRARVDHLSAALSSFAPPPTLTTSHQSLFGRIQDDVRGGRDENKLKEGALSRTGLYNVEWSRVLFTVEVP